MDARVSTICVVGRRIGHTSHGLCHLRPLEKNRWGGVGEGPEKLGRTDNDDEAGLEFWLTGSVTGL